VPVKEAGRYAIGLTTLNYTGRGIVQVSVDGRPLGEPVDMYGDAQPALVPSRVGELGLEAGEHAVRLTVTGRNPASDGYYIALAELSVTPAGAADQPLRVLPNRFRLVFPPDVPASLDRDHETLGKYLPMDRHYQPFLNIVEQSMNARLQPGESACFQNAFQATQDADRRLELRRLTDHVALVRSDGNLALIGAGAGGASVEAGGLRASGEMFCITPERVLLCEATASVGGQALRDGQPADADAVRAALQAAWEAAGTPTASRPAPWADAAPLVAMWSAEVAGDPLSVQAVRAAAGMRLAVGTTGGQVGAWDAAGKPAGEMTTGGPVHALEAADLDGDGAEELLVGSDDENLYALRADLTEIWRRQIPFLRDEQPWMWWTLDSAKVRAIHADDINADGVPELLLGVGNMRLHCYSAAGEELWRFRTDHGICTTIETADFLGNDSRQVLAGNGLTSDTGTCWVLDAAGKLRTRFFNGSWCTALPAIAVGDLDGDGVMTALCGNNRGDVRAYEPGARYTEPLWLKNLTRPIRSLTIIPREGGGLVAVGSDSGYLCAFDQAGEKAWGMPLSSAITHTGLARGAGGAPVLVAGCKDGQVFVVAPDGRLAGHHDLGARLQAMVIADVNGDGRDEIVAATSGPGRVAALRLPG